jgi:hypothetical protein
MTRRFDGDVSISRLAFFALFLTSWASADVVAQDTWKTSSGRRVAGVPVGVGYDQASHEQTFIFEVDGKQTVRVFKSAFSDSAAEKIEAAIKVNSARRAAERHAKIKHQQYEAAKAVLLEEEQKKQAAEQKRQEEARSKEEHDTWLRTTTFVDHSGRTWRIGEIEATNAPVVVGIKRAILKHRDRDQDARATKEKETSLGSQISLGYDIILTLRDILQTPPGKPVVSRDGTVAYETLTDITRHSAFEKSAPAVEAFFDSTDGEIFLIPCRDGTVKTASEAWEEVVSAVVR